MRWERSPTAGWRLGPDGEVIALAEQAGDPVTLTGITATIWSALTETSTAEELSSRLPPDLVAPLGRGALEAHLSALVDAGLARALPDP